MDEAASSSSSSSSSSRQQMRLVEIWENQKYVMGLLDMSLNGGEWISHPRLPYSFKNDGSPAPEPSSYTLPSSNCKWTTNWKVIMDRNGVTTDRRGWEYATRLRTFETTTSSSRPPRTTKTLSDNARRRCYYREYREYDQNRLDEEMLTEVQVGLVIIQGIRKRLQILSGQLRGRLKEDKDVLDLIKTVKTSISTIHDKIKLVEESSSPNQKLTLAAIKFKNDTKKEQQHLETLGIYTSDDDDSMNLSALTTPTTSSPLPTISSASKITTATTKSNLQENKNGDDNFNDGNGHVLGRSPCRN